MTKNPPPLLNRYYSSDLCVSLDLTYAALNLIIVILLPTKYFGENDPALGEASDGVACKITDSH